ncbi:polysaccharide biosynthesis/export family protein [Chryseobacterium sp. POL2]|uniref:polysaccharide biosynthesis/export family protein n=1 Tax=Chryseobacterium sp. POL2 TaxID=2713414 RepID=UPI001627C944|nr:polysaccharide biosynthesis/export family protein [Chryseobacterium sp. POL2]
MIRKFYIVAILLLVFSSCISRKDITYLQPSESLTLNEEGLVPYNIQEYRVTKNDILGLNIITTPKGDAAQFYSNYNVTPSGESGGGGGQNPTISTGGVGSGGQGLGNTRFYFNGIKVDSKGDIYVFGIGFIKAEGRTLEDISQEIQTKVNENFLDGKSEVRLNIDGINYYILGDMESVNMTGVKKAHVQQLNILEALSANGGLNRTVDRKNVVLQRKYPEGIKRVKLDLTREDIMNSPYFWIQNGDMILLSTNKKSISGFGKEPLQSLTTGVSLLTTVLSIYLIFTKL